MSVLYFLIKMIIDLEDIAFVFLQGLVSTGLGCEKEESVKVKSTCFASIDYLHLHLHFYSIFRLSILHLLTSK